MLTDKHHVGQIDEELCHTKAAIAPSKLPSLHVRTDRAMQMTSKSLPGKECLTGVESVGRGGTMVAN